MSRTRLIARKFWEVVPSVMRTVFAASRLSRHKLAPNHFRVLKVVATGQCNLSELAVRQDVSLPSMSATVQTLVERGWLVRQRSESDRRKVKLKVTEKGQRILASEHQRLQEWMAAKLDRLEPADLTRVEEGLDTLLQLFNETDVAADLKFEKIKN